MLPMDDGAVRFQAALGGLPDVSGGLRVSIGASSSPHQSVAENVMLGNEPSRFGFVRQRELERRAGAYLLAVGWSGDPTSALRTQSVVGRRRVQLARALAEADVRDSSVLLIDDGGEELALDDNAEWQDAVALASQSRPVILAVHTLDALDPGIGAVLVVRDGSVVQRCEPTDAAAVAAALGIETEAEPERRAPRHAGDILLDVRDIEVRHPVQATRAVFSGIRFSARAGRITGVVGAHSLELLMSLSGRGYGEVIGGSVTVSGADVSRLSREKAVAAGIVFTTEHPISYDVGLIGGVPSRVSAERLRSLARSGVIDPDREYRPATSPSLVQVGASRPPTRAQFDQLLDSLVNSAARVVLVGEPLLGLDAAERARRIDALERIAEAGKAVVVCGQPADLAALADEVVAVVHGRVRSIVPAGSVSAASITSALVF